MDAFAYSPLSLTSNLAYADIGKNSPATPVPPQAQQQHPKQQQDERFGAELLGQSQSITALTGIGQGQLNSRTNEATITAAKTQPLIVEQINNTAISAFLDIESPDPDFRLIDTHI